MFDSTATPPLSANPSAGLALRRPMTLSPRAARVSSGKLLDGGRELVIEHAGQEYHLRLTRNDKLILTK